MKYISCDCVHWLSDFNTGLWSSQSYVKSCEMAEIGIYFQRVEEKLIHIEVTLLIWNQFTYSPEIILGITVVVVALRSKLMLIDDKYCTDHSVAPGQYKLQLSNFLIFQRKAQFFFNEDNIKFIFNF